MSTKQHVTHQAANTRIQQGLRWFKATMLVVVWMLVFKVIFAFGSPDSVGKLAEALLVLIGSPLVFGLPAFFLGLAAWRKPHPESSAGDGDSQAAGDETAIYSAISDELESGAIDKALWTRLFAQCGGDENKVKAAYIQRRAEVLAAAESAKRSRKMSAQAAAGGAFKATDRWKAHSGMTVTPGAGAESIRWWQLIMSSGVTAVVVAAAYAVYGVPESAVPNLAVDVMELSNLHAIDTSDVHTAPDDPAVLIVDASISHRAEEAQHYPWLELTLTDAHDRPVARRALSPDDYLGKARSPTFLSGTNVQVSFRAHISALPESGAVTRYRLYLFFPSTEPERLASQLNADALRLV